MMTRRRRRDCGFELRSSIVRQPMFCRTVTPGIRELLAPWCGESRGRGAVSAASPSTLMLISFSCHYVKDEKSATLLQLVLVLTPGFTCGDNTLILLKVNRHKRLKRGAETFTMLA